MKIENPLALRFIMQDEVYLLNSDKALFAEAAAQPAAEDVQQPAAELPAQPVAAVSQPIAKETLPVSFNYLGGNKKSVLVITHYPKLDFIDEAHLTALQNIFKRLELSMDDVAIFNRAKYTAAAFAELSGFFKPQKMLLLGTNALPVGMDTLTLNKLRQISGVNTLYSFSFADMMDNNDRKKAFWDQMKQL
jgi:hypothetical protein